MIADIITLGRIPLSLLLFVLNPSSPFFTTCYLLCGVSDAADGFIARRLHTESRTGELLDSTADLFFAAAYAVKILPSLSVPVWILIWAALIAVFKIIGIIKFSKMKHKFYIPHSLSNKIIGLMLFLLPLTVHLFDVMYGAAVLCIAATASAAEELLMPREKTAVIPAVYDKTVTAVSPE